MKNIILLLLALHSVAAFARECPKGDISTVQCEIDGKTFCFQHQFNSLRGLEGWHFAEASMEDSNHRILASDTQDTSYMKFNLDTTRVTEVWSTDYDHAKAAGRDLVWSGFGYYDGTCAQEASYWSNDPELKENASIFPKKVKRCISGTSIKKTYSLNESTLILTETRDIYDFQYLKKTGYRDFNYTAESRKVLCIQR